MDDRLRTRPAVPSGRDTSPILDATPSALKLDTLIWIEEDNIASTKCPKRLSEIVVALIILVREPFVEVGRACNKIPLLSILHIARDVRLLQRLESVVQLRIVVAPPHGFVKSPRLTVASGIVTREKPANPNRQAGTGERPLQPILAEVVDVTKVTGSSCRTHVSRRPNVRASAAAAQHRTSRRRLQALVRQHITESRSGISRVVCIQRASTGTAR